MYELPLQIRRGPTSARPTTAWFLPGGSAHLWLAELVRWDVPQTGLLLWIVPAGANERRPRGLLVTSNSKNLDQASARCHPYGQLGARLYLPVDALLEPEVTARELEDLLAGSETVYLWHPATGLAGFEPSDSLRLENLLVPPAGSTACYDASQPGLHLNGRLLSVTPLDPPPIGQFLAEAGGDIGTQSTELDNLTSETDQSEQPLGHMKRAALTALAGLFSRFEHKENKQVESTAGGDEAAHGGLSGWVNRRLTQGLQEKRNKAIDRLLAMLEQIPDLGLRYALPIAGDDQHRGVAPPSAQLGTQNVDFNLSGLFASGPADGWYIAEESRQHLIERYRQLADREIKLGRHRRAAYIFGHLLGDYHAAASVLKTGGHWREAAQVYQQLLAKPLAAAECLEQGGLWSEAVALYEQLEKFEQAGDLHRRLDHQELAEKAYRRAVNWHLTAADFLAAAQILSSKLAAPREALLILARGWPCSAQARGCLTESFRLRGQLGEHEQSSKQIARLSDRLGGSEQAEAMIKVLAKVAGDYPDTSVQKLAKDRVRLLAGRCLPTARPATAKELLELVSQLDPADRLLRRDCGRFHRKLQQWNPNHPTGNRPRHRPNRRGRIRLPKYVYWQKAISVESGFYAAGLQDRQLLVVRSSWDGQQDVCTTGPLRATSVLESMDTMPNLLLVQSNLPDQIWLHLPGYEPISQLVLPETDHFPRTHVCWPTWADSSMLALGSSPYGHHWAIHTDTDGLLASAYHEETLLHSSLIPMPENWDEKDNLLDRGTLPFFVGQSVRSEAYVGIGRFLIALTANKRHHPIDLGKTIRSIQAVGNDPESGLLVATDAGGIVVWPHEEDFLSELFLSDMGWPILGTASGGWVLAADRYRLEMYRLDASSRRIARQGTYGPFDSKPIALLGMPHRDQFALLLTNGLDSGKVHIYQLPVPTAR